MMNATRFSLVAVLFSILFLVSSPTRPALAQDPGESVLSGAEQSKLDGRFERIVRKAETKVLERAIRDLPEPSPAPNGTRQTLGQTTSDVAGGMGTVTRQQTIESPGGESPAGPPRYSVLDMRPDARTPDGTPVYDALVYTESPSALAGGDVSVTSTFDGFATVRATPSGLRALARTQAVDRVLSPRRAEPHNDVGAAEVGARSLNNGAVRGTAYRGEGTMSCVIDSGIDWSHPDFTDPDGNTRIRAIWDQIDDTTSVNTPVENDASRFPGNNFNPDFGSEYRRSTIQAALDGSGSLNKEDFDGHGTHVTGTAASSGQAFEESSGVKRFQGAAPATEIVTVKAGNASFSNTNILSGIQYCQALAEDAGKPLVINMSLGTDFAPHDGTSPLAQAVAQVTNGGASSGTVVVTSAGNSGSPFSPIHTQKSLSAGNAVDVGVDVTQYTPNSGSRNDFFVTTLWAYQPGPYEVSIRTPDDQDVLTLTLDESSVRDTTHQTSRGTIFFQSAPQQFGEGRSFIVRAFDANADAPPAEGEWTVRIRQDGSEDTPIHGWFQRSQLGSGDTEGSAAFVDADNAFTIGSPATSTGAIAVGNYVHRTRWTTAGGASRGFQSSDGFIRDIISPSSSRGPTVDGRTKPDVAAPGTFTASTFSDDATPAFGSAGVVGDGEHEILTGTSMSAPLVAGSVALLLQEDPTLSTDQTRDLLSSTARVDGAVQARGVPNQTFGAGKLNVQRALTSLMGREAPLEVLSYEDPFNFDQFQPVTIGGTSADSAALRFTPTMRGRAAGIYLSLSANSSSANANRLTDSLYVEVWSDDGNGNPDTQLGDRVAVPPSALTAFTPNFIDLADANVPVASEEDYHVVLVPKDGGGEVDLLAETANGTADRSATFDGNSWSGTGNDLVLRVQVQADVTPPPAVANSTLDTEEPKNVAVSWDGVEAVDLAGYYVYRDTAPIASVSAPTPFDTVDVGTTSYTDTTATEGQTYYYRVSSVDLSGNASAASPSVSAFLYPDDVQAQVSRSFDDGGADSDDYRLVSLPGTVDRDVGDVLSGESDVDWTALWDDGSDSDFLVEYDGSDTFNFRSGRGFWVVSKNDLSFSETFSTVSLEADTATTIPLHSGWNIIANPFGKDVPWSAVEAAHSASLQPIYGFNASFSETDTLASGETGAAYYFLNDQGLNELTIPYPGAPQTVASSNSKRVASTTDGPAITLDAALVGQDAPDATSTIHVRSSMSDQDRKRHVAPPQRFEAVSLRIRDETAKSPRQRFLTTTAQDFQEGQTLPLVLRTAGEGTVRLQADAEALEGRQVALLRPSKGTSYELTDGSDVRLDLDGERSRLKLVVGSESFVENKRSAVRPDEVTLTSYPNPVRQQGTLEYTLPEEQEVTLRIYDALGREVAVLEQGRRNARRHTVRFETDRLSSGIYFGRLTTGERTLTQKITVVR